MVEMLRVKIPLGTLWNIFGIYVPTPKFHFFWVFSRSKSEYWTFLAFIVCKGQIQKAYSMLQCMKALPYQFSLAIKSDSENTRTLRSNGQTEIKS